jgi:hypothetical protein
MRTRRRSWQSRQVFLNAGDDQPPEPGAKAQGRAGDFADLLDGRPPGQHPNIYRCSIGVPEVRRNA